MGVKQHLLFVKELSNFLNSFSHGLSRLLPKQSSSRSNACKLSGSCALDQVLRRWTQLLNIQPRRWTKKIPKAPVPARWQGKEPAAFRRSTVSVLSLLSLVHITRPCLDWTLRRHLQSQDRSISTVCSLVHCSIAEEFVLPRMASPPPQSHEDLHSQFVLASKPLRRWSLDYPQDKQHHRWMLCHSAEDLTKEVSQFSAGSPKQRMACLLDVASGRLGISRS